MCEEANCPHLNQSVLARRGSHSPDNWIGEQLHRKIVDVREVSIDVKGIQPCQQRLNCFFFSCWFPGTVADTRPGCPGSPGHWVSSVTGSHPSFGDVCWIAET